MTSERLRLLMRTTSACALVATAACTYSVENGQTHSGTASSDTVTFGGLTLVPGSTVEVQALSSLTSGAKDSGATWATIGSATAGTSPITNGGRDYYTWSTSVSGIGSAYWPSGGLARLRVMHDAASGGGYPGYTFDDFGCLLENPSETYEERAIRCQSHDFGFISLVDTDPIPAAGATFISFKATSGRGAAYYANIDPTNAKDTLFKWKLRNQFIGPGSAIPPETNARYYNEGDLRFGRDMHCKRRLGGKIACYVTNYGDATSGAPDVGDPAAESLDATINQDPAGLVATVAMEYDPSAATDEVTFYVFDATGARITSAALDSEGAKDVPGLCMACHGGEYDFANDSISGSKFLPFDLDNFEYSSVAGWTRSDQEDEFRTLNEMVSDAGANAATTELIAGWYDDGTGSPDFSATGPDQDSDFVPPGWSSEKTVYLEAVKPYCRTCHVAFYDAGLGVGAADLDFDDVADFEDSAGSGTYSQLQSYVCSAKYMPHAEVTQEKFWESSARAHLVGAFNLSTACD